MPCVTWYNEEDGANKLLALTEVSSGVKADGLTSCVWDLSCLADGGSCFMSGVLWRKKLASMRPVVPQTLSR